MYVIYSKPACIYCVRAKHALEFRGLSYVEKPSEDHMEELTAKVTAATGAAHATYPQIFCGEEYIGGFDKLRVHLEQLEGGKS